MQLLFEEFGKWLNASVGATMVQRDEIFATIFDESEQIMNQPDSALKGLGKLLTWLPALHMQPVCETQDVCFCLITMKCLLPCHLTSSLTCPLLAVGESCGTPQLKGHGSCRILGAGGGWSRGSIH